MNGPKLSLLVEAQSNQRQVAKEGASAGDTYAIVVVPTDEAVKSIACRYCYCVLDRMDDDVVWVDESTHRPVCHDCVESYLESSDVSLLYLLSGITQPLLKRYRELKAAPANWWNQTMGNHQKILQDVQEQFEIDVKKINQNKC